MPEELTPDPTQAITQEAQLAAESMAAGEEKAAAVDIEGDYEASKKYSTSEVDQSGAGAAAAEAATASKFAVPKAEETTTTAESTGNPDDFREMAKETNPRARESS